MKRPETSAGQAPSEARGPSENDMVSIIVIINTIISRIIVI